MRNRVRTGRFAVLALSLLALFGPARADDQRKMTIWGTPPKEKPHFTKGAEGFPPLPLPAVPLRRSEKKRPPAPPMLVANLANFSFEGWKGSPGAVDSLLSSARKALNVWYGWEQLDIGTVEREHSSGIKRKTPVLYLCAYYPLNLTTGQQEALRDYTLAGGTLLINCCGQDKAYDSARQSLEKMFPKMELRPLPADHPVYNSYYEIKKVKYPQPGKSALDSGKVVTDAPRLSAITLGTRAAVIVSHEDLASGWNQWNNPTVKRVDPEDSTRLGLNIITYATSEIRFAKFLSNTQDVAGPAVRPRQELSFAQLIHSGNWNPNPSAVPLFLKDLASNTSVAVQFERKQIELRDPGLFNYPLLYLAGTWDPKFSKEEVAILHRYLTNGGVIIGDCAAGRVEFDTAFRALCKQVFPDNPLRTLPADHPIYSSMYKIKSVQVNAVKDPVKPEIEAIIVNDKPVILYSKVGLCDGWAHVFSAYARAYETPDALKIGTNLVVYAMQ